MSQSGEASASASNDASATPAEIIDVDETNNNSNQNGKEGFEGKVGVPDDEYNKNESVFFSHHYFKKKNITRDGFEVTEAVCLMCAVVNKKKPVYIKITDGNTKGLKIHLNSKHPEYLEQFLKQYQDNIKLKENTRKRKGEFNDGYKQAKLSKGTDNGLKVLLGDRKKLQQDFDESVVLYAAKTFTPFRALTHLDIIVKALSPNSMPKVTTKSHITYSKQSTLMSEKKQNEVMSIIMSSKDSTSCYSFTSDIWSTRRYDHRLNFLASDWSLTTDPVLLLV